MGLCYPSVKLSLPWCKYCLQYKGFNSFKKNLLCLRLHKREVFIIWWHSWDPVGGEDLDEQTGPFSGIQEESLLNKLGKMVLRNCHSHLEEILHYLVSFTLKKIFCFCIYISWGNLRYSQSSGAPWCQKMPSCLLYVKTHHDWELLFNDFYLLFGLSNISTISLSS